MKQSCITKGLAATTLILTVACKPPPPPAASNARSTSAQSPIDPNEVIIHIAPTQAASDASTPGVAGAAAAPDAAASDAATDIRPQQVQCEGVFCPVEAAPAMACCTTQADVTARAARLPGRCGVDLRSLGSVAYGERCWQRDQLGIVDDRCSTPTNEPGCCTDDGTCGTFEAAHNLGCRHAPGSTSDSCTEQPHATGCAATGSFGLRLQVDVFWGGNSGFFAQLTEASRGEIVIYALLKALGDPAGSELQLTGRLCGVMLPAFYSPTLCEAYEPTFPPQLWDAPMVAPLALSGRYRCGDSGCQLSLDPTTHLLGVSLANPDASWPTAKQTTNLSCDAGIGAACFPDQDQDMLPGVQVNLATMGTRPPNSDGICANGYRLRGTPLSDDLAAIIVGVRRADRLLLGTRIRFGGSARFSEDCNRATGSGLAEYINARAVGCLVEPGSLNAAAAGFATLASQANTPCEEAEVRFIDENLPRYVVLTAGATPDPELMIADMTPSKGPALQLVRLDSDDAVSCEQVRAANY